MTIPTNVLHDRLTAIAAQARLISLAALGLNELGSVGGGDTRGIIDAADRIERELVLLADEVHPGDPDDDDDDDDEIHPDEPDEGGNEPEASSVIPLGAA
jgi:hypothetical protein